VSNSIAQAALPLSYTSYRQESRRCWTGSARESRPHVPRIQPECTKRRVPWLTRLLEGAGRGNDSIRCPLRIGRRRNARSAG